jgi:DNA gyrase subunit A
VRRVKPGEKVVMVASSGKAIRFDESEARPMGRDTSGVKGMTCARGARVLGMEIAPEGSDLFVITENGFGKRTPVEEYTEHHRGGQGMATITMTEKKGQLAGMKIVMPGQELMIVSEEGVVIRVQSTDISQLGRATQGVKVMNMSGSDRVCAVARVAATKKKAPVGAGGAIEGQETLFADDDADMDDNVDLDDDGVGAGDGVDNDDVGMDDGGAPEDGEPSAIDRDE